MLTGVIYQCPQAFLDLIKLPIKVNCPQGLGIYFSLLNVDFFVPALQKCKQTLFSEPIFTPTITTLSKSLNKNYLDIHF